MKPRILFVDDEFNVLAGIKRQIRGHFDVELAPGGEKALERLKTPDRYAAIVSDLRMPGVDGLRLLRQARTSAPNVVRVILTGNLEPHTAISAVNDAGVFRILLKPCEPGAMLTALDEAIVEHARLVDQTVGLPATNDGVIALLDDVLGLVNPPASERARRIAGYARHIIQSLGLENPDLLELAVRLSQVGSVTIGADAIHGVPGEPLTGEEQARLERQSMVGARLLSHIPRLLPMAAILAAEHTMDPRERPADELVAVGAQLLRVVTAHDTWLSAGWPTREVIGRLEMDPASFPPQMVAALGTLPSGPAGEAWILSAQQIQPGMVFEDDLHSRDGTLLASKGQCASAALVGRVLEFQQRVGVPEAIRMRVPLELGPAPPC